MYICNVRKYIFIQASMNQPRLLVAFRQMHMVPALQKM